MFTDTGKRPQRPGKHVPQKASARAGGSKATEPLLDPRLLASGGEPSRCSRALVVVAWTEKGQLCSWTGYAQISGILSQDGQDVNLPHPT